MAKHLRYYGEFATVEGHGVRVALYQDADTPFVPEEVRFPADSPLVIEWGDKSKEEVICGSSATLKLISERDRMFTDLYQVEYGTIRLDVWRDGEFYWTGCIDTEFYEEPYESLDGYEVSLTFSDFGFWSRAKFDLGIGFRSIHSILLAALNKTQCVRIYLLSDFDESFEYSTSYQTMPQWAEFPTETKDGRAHNVLATSYVRTDNFCDETGEWMTWEDVLVGMLQPLGIRIIQYKGFVFLYDFDTLYKQNGEGYNHRIYWTSDKQDFAIDKTYNNIKITWSPYASATDLIDEGCWSDAIPTDRDIQNLNNLTGLPVGSGDNMAYVYSYYLPFRNGDVDLAAGFSMWTSTSAKNIILEGGRYAFKIVEHYDGDNSEGVIAYARANKHDLDRFLQVWWANIPGSYMPLDEPGVNPSVVLFKTPHRIISPQSADTPMQLRLTMECLVDCRANPFEEPWSSIKYDWTRPYDTLTCAQAMERFNSWARFLYIPVKVCFKPVGSNKVYCYKNSHVLDQSFPITQMKDTRGYWTEEGDDTYCYLAYYKVDPEERSKGTALCTWSKNRQTINQHKQNLSTQLQRQDDGQYIVYPTVDGQPVMGEIWVEVMGDGWCALSGDGWSTEDPRGRIAKLQEALTFALVKVPTLEIISANQFELELSDEDIVYNAEVNPSAKEELSIDTICGSYVEGIPTARGCYFREDGSQIKRMVRASRVAPVEELLCGTLYSQYAERHVRLSGECRLDTQRYLTFTEDNQEGKKFILSGETQNLITDTTEARFVEFDPDNYDKR